MYSKLRAKCFKNWNYFKKFSNYLENGIEIGVCSYKIIGNMNNLITDIEICTGEPFGRYAIGITDRPETYFRLNMPHELTMLNYGNCEHMDGAYTYFVSKGMIPLPRIGDDSIYLYLFRMDGGILPNIVF